MAEFVTLTDDGINLTCPMPPDETVVEVLLRRFRPAYRRLYFSAYWRTLRLRIRRCP